MDGFQFDKVKPDILTQWVKSLRTAGFQGTLIAAGGVRADNAGQYAATGVDALVSSWMYYAPPMDMTASIVPFDGPVQPVV